jgi:hypothetical protein
LWWLESYFWGRHRIDIERSVKRGDTYGSSRHTVSPTAGTARAIPRTGTRRPEGIRRIYGHVRTDVETVTIELRNGKSVSARTLEQLGYDVRFYVHVFSNGADVRQVVGYDWRGEDVGHAE